MYTSAYEVIEYLVQYHSDNMRNPACDPEQWIAERAADEEVTAWSAFAENFSLDEFNSLAELTQQYEDYESDFSSELWNRCEVEGWVEEEIEEVWENMTMYLSADDKFEAIRTLT